ncbi:MFS transporter [Altererythrobacter sp. CC-YST694]|uniref:MFS transporter n=1 Tax=Altererythrobacter sp. CC-YST694 TaxID=2755038 RepID=UPI001D0246F4|nr:MFS transporter [Altererythrobacter sp. CC-YST694]MCB5426000.1 MFS transporter [Altererythrobacter sp. CC-YST694]
MQITFSEAVSSRPVRLFQYAVVAMVLLVLVFDGMDAQALGLVVPAIVAEWGIDRAAFGTALSASLIGMGIGAWLGGWLGDRLGRLNLLFGAALVFGGATVLSAQVDSVGALALLRFLGGLGFGAAGPNGLALASEWTPERFRTHVISLLSVGTPAGGTIAAGVAPFLLDDLGWRGLFVLFGGASVLAGILALVLLRESPSYLLAKGKRDKAERITRDKLGDDIELGPEAPQGIMVGRGGIVTEIGLFHRGNTRLTLGVGIAFSASTAIVYGLTSWGTELFTSRGFTPAEAIGVLFWMGLLSVAGALCAGYFLRAFGSFKLMAGCSVLTFAALIALGILVEQLTGAPSALMLAVFYGLACLVGGIVSLGISSIYSLMTMGYPVSCRSAGIGLGMLLGRLGGIAMAWSGGYLLNLGGTSVLPFFGVLTVCALAVGSSIWIIDRHIAPAPAL